MFEGQARSVSPSESQSGLLSPEGAQWQTLASRLQFRKIQDSAITKDNYVNYKHILVLFFYHVNRFSSIFLITLLKEVSCTYSENKHILLDET